ncbi:MAG: cob(I)yrinic acid a,c-diamide adenosyltransferase [Thermodesulfovibrionales bacterium]|nr:cob(I)yrinic acid a,c-diamide adenosyltransferase [Thermodesulfovibrionales bacterium]
MRKGYVQVYTGNSKGKTTAALGLALRAAGAGLKVFFAQFIKKRLCSEHKALARFSDLITIRQFGTGFIRGGAPSQDALSAAQKGLKAVKKAVMSGNYDVVILDEINIAIHSRLINPDEVIEIINNKPLKTEIVLTGRYADENIIERADLVTEMKEIKHYYKKGVKARKGIEH